MLPPVPPSVNDGLRIAGKPICSISFNPLLISLTIILFGTLRPIDSIASLNFSLFSALSIASIEAPISSTLYFFKIPALSRSMAKFNAV